MAKCGLNKICRVCGDKALGFNFNGLCCEPCKSFFRRNAFQYEQFVCSNKLEEGCQITFTNRRCCTKCRLNKCFAIGMNKDLICSKLKKIGNLPVDYTNSENDSDCDSMIEAILDTKIRMTMSMCPVELEQKFSSRNILPKSLIKSVKLNLHEIELIKEVTNAAAVAKFYNENYFHIIGEETTLVNALNCAELYIKKLVKLCKNICAFKCLNVDDQLTILKCVFTEMLVICLSYSCRPDLDGIPVIVDDNQSSAVLIKLAVLREIYPQNVVQFFRENVHRFNAELEGDSTIRDLLIAHRIFQTRRGLSCPEYIKYQYTVYNRLLHRYLEHKYGNNVAANVKMQKLNEMLVEMDPIKDILEGLFIKCDTSQLALALHQLFSSR